MDKYGTIPHEETTMDGGTVERYENSPTVVVRASKTYKVAADGHTLILIDPGEEAIVVDGKLTKVPRVAD